CQWVGEGGLIIGFQQVVEGIGNRRPRDVKELAHMKRGGTGGGRGAAGGPRRGPTPPREASAPPPAHGHREEQYPPPPCTALLAKNRSRWAGHSPCPVSASEWHRRSCSESPTR